MIAVADRNMHNGLCTCDPSARLARPSSLEAEGDVCVAPKFRRSLSLASSSSRCAA